MRGQLLAWLGVRPAPAATADIREAAYA